MQVRYFYKETTNEFVITNGICNAEGFVEISKERYDELQEELNAQNENEENEIPKVEYNENI